MFAKGSMGHLQRFKFLSVWQSSFHSKVTAFKKNVSQREYTFKAGCRSSLVCPMTAVNAMQTAHNFSIRLVVHATNSKCLLDRPLVTNQQMALSISHAK